MFPCEKLCGLQWQFLASSKRKAVFRVMKPRSLCRRRCELALCAKSALPVAVLRFQWSANRRVKFSNFIGLPIQHIWGAFGVSWPVRPLPCVLGPHTPEKRLRATPLTTVDTDSHFPHDKCDCTPTHSLVWSCPSLLLSLYSTFQLEWQSPGSNSCCPTSRTCKSSESWEKLPNLSEVYDSFTLLCEWCSR